MDVASRSQIQASAQFAYQDSTAICVTEKDLKVLRDMIRDHLGIYYDDQKLYLLQSRLGSRVAAHAQGDTERYIRFLRAQKRNADEWRDLASLLSTNETYFLREKRQLDALPAIASEILRRRKTFRVWSAACSSGEEPFSIAITLREAGLVGPGQVQIVGTDISERMLERARSGLYRDLSFRAMPTEIRDRHFTSMGDLYLLDERVRKMVSFDATNLLDRSSVQRIGMVDAIFCRNVLIYFDLETQRQVFENLATVLQPGGYLFLGHAETARSSTLFEPVVTPNLIYYRLRAGSAARATA